MWASGADIKLLHQEYTSKQGKASLKHVEEQLPWLEQRGKKWGKKKKKLSTFPSKTVKSLPLLSAWIAFESRHCVSSHTSDFCLLNKRQVWNDLGNFILKSLGSGSTQQKVNLYSCIESGCVSLLSRMDLWKKRLMQRTYSLQPQAAARSFSWALDHQDILNNLPSPQLAYKYFYSSFYLFPSLLIDPPLALLQRLHLSHV